MRRGFIEYRLQQQQQERKLVVYHFCITIKKNNNNSQQAKINGHKFHIYFYSARLTHREIANSRGFGGGKGPTVQRGLGGGGG